jgi:hypothetical protein
LEELVGRSEERNGLLDNIDGRTETRVKKKNRSLKQSARGSFVENENGVQRPKKKKLKK